MLCIRKLTSQETTCGTCMQVLRYHSLKSVASSIKEFQVPYIAVILPLISANPVANAPRDYPDMFVTQRVHLTWRYYTVSPAAISRVCSTRPVQMKPVHVLSV
jgi:hypothetical protein